MNWLFGIPDRVKILRLVWKLDGYIGQKNNLAELLIFHKKLNSLSFFFAKVIKNEQEYVILT